MSDSKHVTCTTVKIRYRMPSGPGMLAETVVDPVNMAGPGVTPWMMRCLADSLPDEAWITDIWMERI